MPSRIIRSPEDIDQLFLTLGNLKPPLTVSWAKKADRSLEQNALMWKWAGEAAHQLADRGPGDVQAEWKLTIGVPILRAEDPVFCALYDETVKGHLYQTKIKIMRDLDFPITSRMTVRQMCRFMDQAEHWCVERGLQITQPDDDLAQYQRRYAA